jgi:bifunctional non-homologous end joining protein LigD
MVLADGFAWSGQTYDSLSKVLYRHACLMGLEGLVSKHRDRPYRAGPSRHWIKVKNPKVAGNEPDEGRLLASCASAKV